MPSIDELFCFNVAETVNSVAPPPGTSFGCFKMFLATDIASYQTIKKTYNDINIYTYREKFCFKPVFRCEPGDKGEHDTYPHFVLIHHKHRTPFIMNNEREFLQHS